MSPAKSLARVVWLTLLTAPALLVPGGMLEPGDTWAGDASPPHSLGACGGTMVGADGQQYPCSPDRKPACNASGARCVCLEQIECGGTRDEPY